MPTSAPVQAPVQTPQQQPVAQPQQPTTPFTDPQGRPIYFVNGRWTTQTGVSDQGIRNYQYQGITPPTNPLFNR